MQNVLLSGFEIARIPRIGNVFPLHIFRKIQQFEYFAVFVTAEKLYHSVYIQLIHADNIIELVIVV